MRTTGAVMSCALLAGMAAAYNPSEIDKVDIIVDYSVGGQDFSFRMDDQDVEANFALQPGTFKIKVQGWLTGQEDNVGVGEAFYGESADTVVTGAETTPITIAITVLDQEVYSNPNDQSIEAAPIIVSISVSPSIIRAGETATLTFTSVDPNIGEVPGSYSLSMGGALSSFARVAGSGVGASTAKECGSGGVCGISYSANAGDYGNLPFDMVVTDVTNGALTDTVSGFVAIDSTGAVVIDANVYHIPEILDGTVTSSSQVVNYGSANSAVIEVPVDDWDLSTGLEAKEQILLDMSVAESAASPVLEDSQGVSCSQGDPDCQKGIACSLADISVSTDTVGQVKTFTLTWTPWATNTDPMADYGETWCEFTFTARDSQNLVSQTTTVVLAAIGTASTGGSFTQLPLFEVIAVETYTPTINDNVELLVYMRDPDSDFTLSVDQSQVSDTASQSFALNDPSCTTQCDQAFVIPFDKTGLAAGSATVTLTLTDGTNPNLVDVRTLTFTVASARRRGRRSIAEYQRRAAEGTGLSFTIEDGSMSVAKTGDWGSSSNNNNDDGSNNQDDAAAAGGSAGLSAGIIAGVATGGAVALIAVGVALQRKRAAAAKSGNANIAMTYDDEFSSPGKGNVVSQVV